MNAFMNVMHTTTCNCAACAPVPTLGIKMPYEEDKEEPVKTRKGRQKLVVGENDLATVAPKVAAMLSEKDKHLASEVIAGSNKKAIFMCPDCHQEFEATISHVVRSVGNGTTGCPVCAGRKIVSGINDIASQYPEVAAMLSEKDKHIAFKVGVGSTKKAIFICPDCKQRFEAKICYVVRSVRKCSTTGCPVCAGQKVVSGINDLASQHPEVAAMLSKKSKHIAFEVTSGSTKKAVFICPDCKQEFESPHLPRHQFRESRSYWLPCLRGQKSRSRHQRPCFTIP